jgi:hypothetical protein
MKKIFLSLTALAMLFSAGCSSTQYFPYQGSGQLVGSGGAALRMNGVDLWINGSPPRKFYVVGYIEDVRPGGPGPMSMRNYRLTEKAHAAGGDGVLVLSDRSQYVGTFSSGNAFTTANASVYGNNIFGSALTTGSAFSMPMFRREGRYYVIKYL